MKNGVHINLDNEVELALVDKLLKENSSKSTFGLRLNPMVGAGLLAYTSTATKESKFGLPIGLQFVERQNVLDLFQTYKWLSGVHFHIGSQGMTMNLFQKGAEVCMDFVQDLEKCGVVIKTINIG